MYAEGGGNGKRERKTQTFLLVMTVKEIYPRNGCVVLRPTHLVMR